MPACLQARRLRPHVHSASREVNVTLKIDADLLPRYQRPEIRDFDFHLEDTSHDASKSARTAALLFGVAISVMLSVKNAVAQFPSNQPRPGAFTGAWCAQGDPTKHASISSNGAFLTLTNENGDTSPEITKGKPASSLQDGNSSLGR